MEKVEAAAVALHKLAAEHKAAQAVSDPADRLVASAKSWICHGGINRRAPVLPWNAPENEPQISPYGASVQYLAHLKSIWDASHRDAPLAQQDVTITVPASFDEAARELTLDAAKEAGAPVAIAGFVRFALGEGIERKQEDFAAEVASVLKT